MDISLQMYSVKDAAALDYTATVERVARMGYAGVELDGWGNLPASDMKALLQKNGLYAVGSHTQARFFGEDFEKVLAWHKAVGAQYIMIPGGIDLSTRDKVMEFCDLLNAAAEQAAEWGLKVGYHNHAHEFEKIDGQYALDIIAENTSDNVVLEIDVYWVQYAGVDPYSYVEKLGKKAELIHLKQIGPDGENTPLADGLIDMKKMIESSRHAKYFIIEQETFLPDLEKVWAIQQSNIDHLNNLGL